MKPQKTPHKAQIDRLIENRKKHVQSLVPLQLITDLQAGNKLALSESITLIESKNTEQNQIGQAVLSACLPHTGKSIRIGITGVPGVGKSTFIEHFGLYLVGLGKKVAVLAIDPSSEISNGSILGDKTRMNGLATHPLAFIRPTATSGTLGGVAQKTRETILLCEAAGYEIILVETVGVGQSETEVHSMTDFFLLLMLAGGGDELQGIKRGIMEMADTILITKTDGNNIKTANLARSEFANALHLFPPNQNQWIPKVETISAQDNKGIDKVWEIVNQFNEQQTANGWKNKNRQQQQLYWMNETVKNQLLADFNQTPGMESYRSKINAALQSGEITSYQAAVEIIAFYKKNDERNS